jgi:hypothetical protein
MDTLLSALMKEINNYSKVSRSSEYSASEKSKEQAVIKGKLEDIYREGINSTQSKNLTAYNLAWHLKTSNVGKQRINQHHGIRPLKGGRIVYDLTHGGHSRAHWFCFLETGDAYHISVAQSQNSARYFEIEKSLAKMRENSTSQQIETSKPTSQQKETKN